jgi:hypothetical protein
MAIGIGFGDNDNDNDDDDDDDDDATGIGVNRCEDTQGWPSISGERLDFGIKNQKELLNSLPPAEYMMYKMCKTHKPA